MGIETLASWYALAGAGASAAATAYTANKAANAQEDATAQATKTAQATATAAAEANNKANQKTPNAGAMLSSNQMAAKGGQSGTMLTGPAGIDPNLLKLGKTTLLGGGA